MGLSENRCFEKRRKSSASVVEIFENIRIFERESKHGQNQGVGRRVVCQGKKRKQLSRWSWPQYLVAAAGVPQ